MTEFASPGTASGGLDLKTLNGRLLLVVVHSHEHGVKTSFGEKDPIRAAVTVLDGPEEGETFKDTLIFPSVLIGQLRSRVGQKVLGRLGQGQAKSGQNAPWLLNEATDADVEVGKAWVAKNSAPAVVGAAPPF